MELRSLKKRPKTEQYPKTLKLFNKFQKLLEELSKKPLPSKIVEAINEEISGLNNSLAKERKYHEDLRKAYNDIIKLIRTELKIVPKHYYRNLWMSIGMPCFGLPLGTLLGLVLDNMAFLGVGLPIGMAIGIAIGSNLDNKTKEQGKQINVEV